MGTCKERAWETLTKLSFERVTGTPEELKAANIILEECEKAGVEAHFESYEIDMPEITEAFLAITKPEYKEIPCIGIGKTGQTPEEGITGPLVYIENGLDANLTDVAGKICMVQGRTAPDLSKKLKEKGAIGYISIQGSFYDDEQLKNELRPRNAFGKPVDLPGTVIHISDAEELVRAHPEELKMIVRADNEKKGTSQNVVATIEGTDLKDEIVAFSAHYDSVRYSSGAWDNGTGSITILELMHYYAENKPRRTVKFIWCGSEEIGLVGSKEYVKAHYGEMKDYIFDINFDMTGVTIGYEHFCCTASNEVLHAVEYLAKLENYPVTTKLDLYSSDSTSFASVGVPSCTFARLAPMGGATIHNHHDILGRLDPDSFMITLDFVVKFSSQVVNAPINVIPRKIDEGLTKKLDEMIKMRGLDKELEEAKKAAEDKEEEKKEEE